MAESPVSDKKRTRLQALEGRLFSSAKKVTDSRRPNSSSQTVASTISTTSTSTPSAAVGDLQDPVYAQLSGQILNGPVGKHLKLSREENGRQIVDSIIRGLVQDSGKAVRNLDDVLDSKVQDRVLLLDNPGGQSKAIGKARKRAAQMIANRSNKHLSKRQHKLIGSFDLPLQYQRFELFQPMHELWKSYATGIVNNNSGEMIEHSMAQLDLHGAYLAVVQAKIDNQVGLEGIMIRETTNTLALVTKEDRIRVIQKAGSVFIFRVENMCVAVYGDRMLTVRGVASDKP